jgi:hypothetical protein
VKTIAAWLADVQDDGTVRVSREGKPVGIWPSLMSLFDDMDPESNPWIDLAVALPGTCVLPPPDADQDPDLPFLPWLAPNWVGFTQEGKLPPMAARIFHEDRK